MYPLRIIFVFFVLAVSGPLFAQEEANADSAVTSAQPAAPQSAILSRKPATLSRPWVEFGFGPMSFYGDVGQQNGQRIHPWVAPIAWSLALTTPLHESLELRLQGWSGSAGFDERGPSRNVNFKSDLKGGGLHLVYNLSPLVSAGSTVKPYISAGIEAVEFLSKTDMYDAQGRLYHYWNDGSIRSLAQNDPLAAQAEYLTRDYVYETDLRDLNLDGQGKYNTSTLSIPVGIGATIQVNENFRVRMGTSMHFTLTDNIDNVMDEGEGVRQGTNGNDRLMFSSIGIAYNLRHNKAADQNVVYGSSAAGADLSDEDNDGIADLIDLCPFTPSGVKVDKFGCPVDSDGDGVADYQDDEINSSPGAVVNARGVTVTDDELRAWYLAYRDSMGMQVEHSSIATGNVIRYRPVPRHKNQYSVMVGYGDAVDSEIITKLLAIRDIKTIELNNQTYYMVGSFEFIEDAIARRVQLEQQGILGSVAVQRPSGTIQMVGEQASILEDVFAANDWLSLGEKYNSPQTDVVFRVQVGAFKQRLSANTFSDVNDLLIIKGDDGLTRYVSGSFTNMKDAAERRIALLLDGYEGAFITAYRDGKRITLKEAGAQVTADEQYTNEESETLSGNEVYSIQLGEFSGVVPTATLTGFIGLGNVRPLKEADGRTRYLSGTYNNAKDAEKALRKAGEKHPQAKIVKLKNGKVIQD